MHKEKRFRKNEREVSTPKQRDGNGREVCVLYVCVWGRTMLRVGERRRERESAREREGGEEMAILKTVN